MTNKLINAKHLQNMCQSILEAKGENYRDWLYDKQMSLLIESSETISQALKNKVKEKE